MLTFRFAALAVALLAVAPGALAQGRAKTNPDWPCFQIKVPEFSLNSVWSGPEIDLKANAWRDDSALAELVGKMAQRRVPVGDAEAAIASFVAKGGAEAKPKLLIAMSGAFQELTRQRSQILEGLERFGKRQHEMAEKIRVENESLQSAASDQAADPSAEAREKLQWDVRIFEDRHRSITFVCETPTLIEQRIGALARAVQGAL